MTPKEQEGVVEEEEEEEEEEEREEIETIVTCPARLVCNLLLLKSV